MTSVCLFQLSEGLVFFTSIFQGPPDIYVGYVFTTLYFLVAASSEKALIADLLGNYVIHRPVHNWRDTLNVSVGFSLHQNKRTGRSPL